MSDITWPIGCCSYLTTYDLWGGIALMEPGYLLQSEYQIKLSLRDSIIPRLSYA